MLVCILYNFIDRKQQHSVFKKLGFVFKLYGFLFQGLDYSVYTSLHFRAHSYSTDFPIRGSVG